MGSFPAISAISVLDRSVIDASSRVFRADPVYTRGPRALNRPNEPRPGPPDIFRSGGWSRGAMTGPGNAAWAIGFNPAWNVARRIKSVTLTVPPRSPGDCRNGTEVV